MCLIAFAWQRHPRWRLLLAGNRDEFYARPSTPLARWAMPDAAITAGRDLRGGGTWLGITDEGRCASVTNVRDGHAEVAGLSRGLLPLDYLNGELGADAFSARLLRQAVCYRPFNALLFDAREAYFLSNAPRARREYLSAGVYAISNGDLNAPWPKTVHLRTRLQNWLDTGDDQDVEPLFDALADDRVAPDEHLPDTGVGLQRERWLSSAFIRSATYGTRASSLVAIGHDGRGWMIERRFDSDGLQGETRVAIGANG